MIVGKKASALPATTNVTSSKLTKKPSGAANKSQKRESSNNSDKANNSLLKLKSRNRVNENLVSGAENTSSTAVGHGSRPNGVNRQVYHHGSMVETMNHTVKPKLSEQQ